MWKVKRMNTPRIVVLTIAVGAGGIAAYLASGSDNKPPTAPVAQLQNVDVLVAKSEIAPETGAVGFILPNDRVDVILSKREKNPDRGGSADIVNSEVILANVRVLAIDQTPKERDGQSAVIGKTVTLELRPEQGETL